MFDFFISFVILFGIMAAKRQTKRIDLFAIFKKYKGLWVALTDTYKVISADESVRKVTEDAKQRGYPRHILFKVPKKNLPFIGIR